jgi:hypothetical protein
MEKLVFTEPQTGEKIECYVLEQTTVAGMDYLLVTEEEEGDADCWILKKITEENEEVLYEFVEDDDQLDALAKIFEELLEDVKIDS